MLVVVVVVLVLSGGCGEGERGGEKVVKCTRSLMMDYEAKIDFLTFLRKLMDDRNQEEP